MKNEKELWDYIQSKEVKVKTNSQEVRRSKQIRNEDKKEIDLDYLFENPKMK